MARLGKIEPKKVPTTKEKAIGKAGDDGKPESEWKENVVAVLVVAIIVLLFWGFAAGWFHKAPAQQTSVTNQTYLVSIDDDPMLGAPDANITIIEFSDYTCTACAAFQRTTFPQLKAEYIDTGKVRFVFRDFPLKEVDSLAGRAAQAADCANEQDVFWKYHDLLFREQSNISNAFLVDAAEELGLNATRFAACLDSGKYRTEVLQDYLEGVEKGGITGTPVFFINGKKLQGNQPITAFRDAIAAATRG